jgi:hypothetical protein
MLCQFSLAGKTESRDHHSCLPRSIVELRFFGSLTIAQTAGVLGLSPTTIKREWNTAQAWLFRELYRRGTDDS